MQDLANDWEFGHGVIFNENKLPGTIQGVAEYAIDETRWLISYLDNNGNVCEDWFRDSALRYTGPADD